jgi:prepilin-type N-terminal cleavage/methylation domain-containing protein
MIKKGFTFLEILISTFILSLIMLGLISVFISSKRLINYSKSRITAAELGRLFLDPLQLHVRQDTWGTAGNNLSEVNNGSSTGYGTSDGLDKSYNATYTICYSGNCSVAWAGLALTRVKTTINWTESAAP